MAGRKPPTDAPEIGEGNGATTPAEQDEPKPPVMAPSPPSHLDEKAGAKFAEMAELLARHGVMTELDVGALTLCGGLVPMDMALMPPCR